MYSVQCTVYSTVYHIRKLKENKRKQEPTQYRPIAHLVVSRYLSYSSLQTSEDMSLLVCKFKRVTHPNWWRHDHGSTNIGVMVKKRVKFPNC